MRDYSSTSPHTKKVMRSGVVLFWIPIALVFLIAFNILNWPSWEISDNHLSIVSSVIIILPVAVFTFATTSAYQCKHYRHAPEKYCLCVRNSILFLDEKVIPYLRIQNIGIDVGPIMRRYQLATLTLYTADDQVEIELIDRSEVRRLKRWLSNERHLGNNKNRG